MLLQQQFGAGRRAPGDDQLGRPVHAPGGLARSWRDCLSLVGELVCFLASDAAAWLTGQVITLDGGATTRLFLNL